jgi:hypothetical protein
MTSATTSPRPTILEAVLGLSEFKSATNLKMPDRSVNRMKRLGAALALAAMLAATTPAHALALMGTVTDEQGRVLPHAIVYLFGDGLAAATDENGTFELRASVPEQVMSIAAEGYGTTSTLVHPTDPTRTFVLHGLEAAGPTEPFEGTAYFPLNVSIFNITIPPSQPIQSVPFFVGPGANGGSIELSWEPNFTRLQANVVHVATGTTFGYLQDSSPMRFPIGSALVRDFPGAYRLEIDHRDGPAVNVTAHASVYVTYGPWVAKTVLGEPAQVVDGMNDHPTAVGGGNDGMDIVAIRFANETDEQVDVEMDLARLEEARGRHGWFGYWSVIWTYKGAVWRVFMEADAAGVLHWYAGKCEETPLSCNTENILYGTAALGTPGRIRWHVPKIVIGNPQDGESLEQPYGLNYERQIEGTILQRNPFPKDVMIVSDDTPPDEGRPYTFGAHQYDIPPSAADSLNRTARAGEGAPPALSGLGLAGVTVLLTTATGAAGFHRHRRKARATSRYRTLRVLGQGASGRTTLARDSTTGALVAIKQCTAAASSPSSRARLLREARIASRISHPNVVRVLDVQERPDGDAIAMEFVSGGSLEVQLANGPIPLRRALELWRDILAGLAAIHAAGIVHRDVKPSNILLTEQGVAKLADFGVARAVHEETIAESGPVGTPLYMAPEVLKGEEPTPASDTYAATAVLYRMLTARPHLDLRGDAWQALVDRRSLRPQPPPAGVPTWVNALLAQGLAENPARRGDGAVAFLREIDRHMPPPLQTRPRGNPQVADA